MLQHNEIISINTAAIVSMFYETENEPSSTSDIKMLVDQFIYSTTLTLTIITVLVVNCKTIGSPAVLNCVM